MKKWIAFLLTAILTAGFSLPAGAAEAASRARAVEVSLNSIEKIMEEYNLDLKTIRNNLEIAQNNSEDHEGEDDEDYYDNLYDIAKEQYEQNVHGAVLSAKRAYLLYCADNDRLAAAQDAADSARKSLNSALQSLSLGYASQKDVDALRQQADQAQNALTRLDDQLTQEKASLRKLLNLSNGVIMNIKPVSDGDFDFSGIPAIRYGEDAIMMRGNSTKIQAAKLAYQYQEDYHSTNAELDNAYIALQQAQRSEEAAFKKLYDALNSSYTVYQQDLSNIKQKESELEFEQNAFSLGFSTQKAVDGKAQELKAAKTALADDRNALFLNYFSYMNMKIGYSLPDSLLPQAGA